MWSLYSLSSSVPWLEIFCAGVLGVCVHVFYFIHGEHHMHGMRIIYVHILAFCALKWSISLTKDDGNSGWNTALTIFGSYITSLFASIIIYRRFFHRLRRFPGPPLAGMTKLWHMSKNFRCKNHLLLDDMYKRYGKFVRTGPTELTVFAPGVKWAVDGPGNNCKKAVWYDILLPLVALNTSRSKAEHDGRRRAWEEAITAKNMEVYLQRIPTHIKALEKHIATQVGKAINITELLNFLAFDVMGDFAFGKSFDMLETQEWHYAVKLLRRALALLGPFSSVPWLAQIGFGIPIIPVIRAWNRMLRWCADRMAEQVTSSNCAAESISSHLISASRRRNTLQQDSVWLKGDSVALIVAGSDTVASTLVHLLYRLTLHPEHAEKLRCEVDALGESMWDAQALKNLEHMQACINEVLRMHPSVPTGGDRETPPEGLVIDGMYIPGNVTIVAPRYTINRLETSYQQPNEFIPERWYSRPELVADRRAFEPFSIGRYSCVGKQLALAEIRLTAAVLLHKFKFDFAPHEDGTNVLTGMNDQFVAVPGRLELVFSPRT